MTNYHVSKSSEGRKTQKADASLTSGHFSTQVEAKKVAKHMSSNTDGTEVRIHGSDGMTHDFDTVAAGNDPYPLKDTQH